MRAGVWQPKLEDGERSLIDGRFHLQRPLNSSSVFSVWLASDSDGMSHVLKTGPESALATEYQFLSACSHPHFVAAVDWLDTVDGPFIVFEHLSGGDLVSLAGMRPEVWLKSVQQLLEALVYLHALGFAHRDLKARHVMFDAASTAKLIDFGSVLAFGSPWQFGGTTASARPPDRPPVTVSSADDTYAFAALLHEMLYGYPPAGGDDSMQCPSTGGPLAELVATSLASPCDPDWLNLERFADVIKWTINHQRMLQ